MCLVRLLKRSQKTVNHQYCFDIIWEDFMNTQQLLTFRPFSFSRSILEKYTHYNTVVDPT